LNPMSSHQDAAQRQVPATTEEPSITERVSDAAQNAAQTVKQMATDAKDKVVEGAQYLKEKVTGETPAEATTGAARDVGRDIKGAAADVKESAAAGVERVKESLPSKQDVRAKTTQDDAAESIGDKLHRAGDKASELAGAAKEKIAEGAHELNRKITGEETTGEAVQGAGKDVGHTASRAAQNVKESAAAGVERVKESLPSKQDVGRAKDDAKYHANEAARNVRDDLAGRNE
jgi:predicted small secreted protein